MANYANLKADVQAVITTNGNNEITGALLQSLLISMINSLGVGYQYMGMATPSTNPGTPDQNVFYLASVAGTYTNFNGLVLDEYEVGILRYDGSWHLDQSGFASSDSLAELADAVQGRTWTESHAAGGGTYELSVPLKPGDIISNVVWNGVARIALKSDSSGTVTQYVYPTDIPYVVEDNFAYWTVYLSGSPTVTMTVLRRGVKDSLQALEEAIGEVDEEISGEELTPTAVGSVIKLTGGVGSTVPSPTSATNYSYVRKAVSPGDILAIPSSGTTSSYGGALAFVDSSNKLVTNAKAAQTATNILVQVPNGVAEVIINKPVAAANPILYVQGTKGWEVMYNSILNEGVADECGFIVSRKFGLLLNPARSDGSDSNSGYYGGYLVDLTGIYPNYKYIYFRGANYTLASNIVRGIILDANGNIESMVPKVTATTDGWQALPLTANSKKLWATYAYSTYGSWLPQYVIFQNTDKKLSEILGSVEGSLDVLDGIDDQTPILPKEIHAVISERVLLFKNAIVPGNVENLLLSVGGGKNFKRYMNYIPTGQGTSVLTAKVKNIQRQCNIRIVSPSNPSSAKNILVVGASAVANYATQYEELYRRLALTTGNNNITEFGISIKDPTNPKGLGLSNIHFVGRKTNGQNFKYEATGGYTFANYYGAATTYNYAFIVADTSIFVDGAVYSDGTHNFTINEISGSDNRISCQCPTQGVSLPASGSLSKVSGSGASSLVYSEYSATLTRPFLNPNTNATSLQYYMNQYCGGASVDIVVFNGLLFNSGYNWSLLENNAKPLARIIHSEYPSAKLIFCTNALVDTRGFGEAYVYKSTNVQGQTKTVNDLTREFAQRLDTLCDELNTEFGSTVCISSYVGLQCDSDYDYPVSTVPVDNRNTATEPIGTNGVHPTSVGILNQVDALYRSICFVIAQFFN